jgi:hypothetical protein
VAAGDFNSDGLLDLVVGSGYGLMILLGNGDGTFHDPQYLTSGALGVAVGDVNGDGIPDLVGAAPSGVIVLLGNGDGTFKVPQSYPIGGEGANFIAIADFNRDGIPDVAVAYEGHGFGLDAGLSILLGNGDGTF